MFLIVPTVSYWLRFFKGPILNLYAFARFHQVRRRRLHQSLAPFYIKNFVDYFFVTLKRHLMPLVFILVVMDFRIILPRLVQDLHDERVVRHGMVVEHLDPQIVAARDLLDRQKDRLL